MFEKVKVDFSWNLAGGARDGEVGGSGDGGVRGRRRETEGPGGSEGVGVVGSGKVDGRHDESSGKQRK